MLEFYKYHGTGNDFIIIDNREKAFDTQNTELIKNLCHRKFGIGADGIIFLELSEKADCFMNYYNNDGTIAEMCGNGVRCLAKFFIENIKSDLQELLIDTRAGIKKVLCNNDGSFSVNMGKPTFVSNDFPKDSIELEKILFQFVSMGNPHAVGFVENISNLNLPEIGPKIENNKNFPNKINTEFVEKISENHFKVRVWERGCGETMACGTGACAIYSILEKNNPNISEITLEFPGGNLYLSKNEIILRGPAVFVYKGEIK